MNTETAVRRAQVYLFLADAFLYPHENWLADTPALQPMLRDLGLSQLDLRLGPRDCALADLQAEHRHALGLTGSLCYETECGLPNEFRQSQEMADLAGFYRAFGFAVGGPVRERPDHIAAELEFMHVLALKQAYAGQNGLTELVEICADAQHKFLRDHLGRWIGLLAEALARSAPDRPYALLARFAAAFVGADAERLGVRLEARPLADLTPTPAGPELACGDCPAAT